MMTVQQLGRFILLAGLALLVGIPLYAVPATLSLPPGVRPGLPELTITQAAEQLRDRGSTGWALVEEARALVGKRMVYSRRNSFDSSERAFVRGYGYCTQHAFALLDLLTRLGYQAKVVQAFRNQFPNGMVTSHAWVSVTIDGQSRFVDPLFYDEQVGEVEFVPLSEITDFPPAFKIFAWWGGTAINAHRFYVTGKDFSG